MKDNEKCNIPHAPQHQGPKKYNNTEMKLGQRFMAATQPVQPMMSKPIKKNKKMMDSYEMFLLM